MNSSKLKIKEIRLFRVICCRLFVKFLPALTYFDGSFLSVDHVKANVQIKEIAIV